MAANDPKTSEARCVVVRSGSPYDGLQGLTYRAGLTRASAGSRTICMTVVTLPPGARSKAHLHRDVESAAYVIEGRVDMWFGSRLEHHVTVGRDEYAYMPPEVPHLVANTSDRPARALVAHTAPDDQEGIVLLPELDALMRGAGAPGSEQADQHIDQDRQ